MRPLKKMNVIKEGKGPVVVLSHALALDHAMWADVVEVLGRQYTLVRYDHRGHGSATGPNDPFSIEDLADDAAAVIKLVSASPVVFAGLSLGGMVGQVLAVRYPSLVRGLALINTAAHYPDRSTWDTRIQAVRDGGMRAIVGTSLERWLTPAFRDTAEGQIVTHRLRNSLLRMDPQAYVRTCEAIASMDLRVYDRRIATPTLIVAGLQDAATPLAMSQAMATDIAGARLAEVDAAHVSAAECPARIATLLDDWIQTLPAGA